MITHKIITNDGYVVCECESLKEAAQCKAELIAIDKADGTYEKGFYKIVRAWLLQYKVFKSRLSDYKKALGSKRSHWKRWEVATIKHNS